MFYLYHIHNANQTGNYSSGYIGITDNSTRREQEHFNKLRKGTHDNPKLQRAYHEYNLVFTVLTQASERTIVATLEEQFRSSANMAWNVKKGGEGVSVNDLLKQSGNGKRLPLTKAERKRNQALKEKYTLPKIDGLSAISRHKENKNDIEYQRTSAFRTCNSKTFSKFSNMVEAEKKISEVKMVVISEPIIESTIENNNVVETTSIISRIKKFFSL